MGRYGAFWDGVDNDYRGPFSEYRLNQCMRKVKWVSWREAREEQKNMRRNGKNVEIYKCEWCNNYHLGRG